MLWFCISLASSESNHSQFSFRDLSMLNIQTLACGTMCVRVRLRYRKIYRKFATLLICRFRKQLFPKKLINVGITFFVIPSNPCKWPRKPLN